MMPRSGLRMQTGSVFSAAPVRANAWQRQPPKSTVFLGQERQGSRIQLSPREAVDPGDSGQIQSREWSRALGQLMVVIWVAPWQGSTLPSGATTRYSLPQPP